MMRGVGVSGMEMDSHFSTPGVGVILMAISELGVVLTRPFR